MRIHDLKDAAETEYQRAKDNWQSSSEASRDGPYQKTAEECSCLQNTDTIRVHVCRGFLWVSEVLLESGEGEDTACVDVSN